MRSLLRRRRGYFVETRWGGSEDAPSPQRMAAILAELDVRDPEHPDTWLGHSATGWTLTAYETGLLIWSNPERDVPDRHMRDVPRERVLELWQLLAAGDFAAVDRAPWSPGTGLTPPTSADLAKMRQAQLALDRTFYDSLGPERSGTRCQAPDCTRGCVVVSVFCRPHHFESVRRREAPFRH